VKALNSEGIASHAGRESCVVHREVRDEALTGEPAGQPLSRESLKLVQGADAISVVEGNMDRRVIARVCSTLRGLRGCLKSPANAKFTERGKRKQDLSKRQSINFKQYFSSASKRTRMVRRS